MHAPQTSLLHSDSTISTSPTLAGNPAPHHAVYLYLSPQMIILTPLDALTSTLQTSAVGIVLIRDSCSHLPMP